MVFRVVTWIITVIIGAVRALCPCCARAVRKRPLRQRGGGYQHMYGLYLHMRTVMIQMLWVMMGMYVHFGNSCAGLGLLGWPGLDGIWKGLVWVLFWGTMV